MGENVEAQLRDAGWYPGRTVDITHTLSAFATHHTLPAPLLDFLPEYTGLVVEANDGRFVRFDPQLAAHNTSPEWTRSYATLTSCDLVPIGEYSHMTIYLGADGLFYGGYDREFGRLGSTVREVLDRLLNDASGAVLDLRVAD